MTRGNRIAAIAGENLDKKKPCGETVDHNGCRSELPGRQNILCEEERGYMKA